MPQHYQPNTLYNLTLNNSILIINDICKNIEKQWGNYDSIACQEEVAMLQKYLVLKLPRLILDTVFNAIEDLDVVKDPRILLALFMHKNIRYLEEPVNVINKRLSIKPSTDFWIRELPRLRHLVHLNLKLNCTDSILEVVGKYCKKLEYINIISKTESERLKTGNALKIRYLVSDQGLQYLTNCKELREVEMNPILRSNFGGKLTISGIRLLIKSFKCLQSISFNYMGEVLANTMDDFETLQLQCITDYDSQPKHMVAIARLCPNIHTLVLICSKHDSDVHTSSSTIAHLSDSSLHVRHLHIEKFDFNIELRRFFQIKGEFISSLVLKSPGTISSADIQLIGSTCPNITSLHLSDPFQLINTNLPILSPCQYYIHLQRLCILGKDWEEEAILEICLSKATQIEVLCLYKNKLNNELVPLDLLLTNILKKNQMNNLKTLCLCTGRPISLQMVKYFYSNCSKLETFLMNNEDLAVEDDFVKLQREISENNFNLNLKCTTL